MRKKILNTIWVMGVLALAGFCLSACNHELDIQQAYPFTVETMPVQKHIVKGQTAEIRCTLKRQGRFEDARYTIRYFQPDGKGILKMDNGTVFKPNDRYPFIFHEVVISHFADSHLFCFPFQALHFRFSSISPQYAMSQDGCCSLFIRKGSTGLAVFPRSVPSVCLKNLHPCG